MNKKNKNVKDNHIFQMKGMVIFVSEIVVYIMVKQNVSVIKPDVELCDIASVYCDNEIVLAKAKAIKIHHFKDGQPARVVISTMKIISQILEIDKNLTVQSLGETDVIVEKASLQHDKRSQKKGIIEVLKVIFVSLICFLGSGFTIMAFHNDVGVPQIFANMYRFVTGMNSDGFTVLEVSYSIGLSAGIIIFYNHVGGKMITSDPTPLEVEMRNYERDVNQAIVDMAERQGIEKDVM